MGRSRAFWGGAGLVGVEPGCSGWSRAPRGGAGLLGVESRLLGVEPCNPAGRRPRPRCPPPAPWPQRIAPPPASWPNGSEDGRDDGEDAAEDTADGGGEDSEDDSGLTSPTATMLTSLLDADPASPLPTAATAVAAWFAHGHARGELKLGLLPFLLEHAMLPGERRCVFLFD